MSRETIFKEGADFKDFSPRKDYPCFDGIENFTRNFAMKCRDFSKK